MQRVIWSSTGCFNCQENDGDDDYDDDGDNGDDDDDNNGDDEVDVHWR